MKQIIAVYGLKRGVFLSLWLICMSLYHLYSAGFGVLPTEIHRSIHLTFAIVAVFLMYPLKKKSRFDWFLAAVAAVVASYPALFNDVIAERGALVQSYEMGLGILAIVFVLEAGRRVAGRVLPFLGVIFLAYALWGRYVPGIFMHRGFSVGRIVQQMYLTTEGIYGVALGVSATYVFLFILFGAFLAESGGIRLFNDLSMALAGASPGGPAKVAVLASALLGTISGSSVGNVATTGAMTIPMMKKVGYDGCFAGAVEACASTGGQLMPPIMGAGAFVMAQFLGISYLEIARAAIIPAILYYGALLLNVHLRARRKGLRGVSSDEIPSVAETLRRDGHLLIPLVVIIWMLVEKYTPLAAAFWGIVSTVLVASFRCNTRLSICDIADAMVEGARNALSVAIACAVVGIVVGVATLTALGMTVSSNIMDLAGGNLPLALLVAMLACLLMGMGLPTTANYIVTSTVIAPALIKMGVLPLAAHMFVFYFGIMADITPPVCLASFTAAGIAGADPLKTGCTATVVGIIAYLLPFAFVYDNSLLLQGELGSATVLTMVVASLGVLALAASVQGWIFGDIPVFFRFVAFIGGIMAFSPVAYMRSIAAFFIIALTAAAFLKEYFCRKKAVSA